MQCPRCQVESLDSHECHACGIVFAKWLAREAIAQAEAEETRRAEVAERRVVSRWFRPRRRELVDSYVCISRFIESGTSIIEAIDFLSGAKRSGLERVYADLGLRLREGEGLAEAVANYPQVFSPQLIAELRAAEKLGALAPVFDREVARFALAAKVRLRLRRKLTYPLFIAMLWAVASPITSTVLGGAGYVQAAGLRVGLVLLLFVALPTFLVFAVRHTRAGTWFQWIAWRGVWPFSVYLASVRYRFLDGLSAHFAAGISVVRALSSASESTADPILVNRVNAAVARGALNASLAKVLTESRITNAADGVHLVTAEKTGTLVESLERLASFYHDRFAQKLSSLIGLMTTAITIAVFAAVAYEIYSTYNQMHQAAGGAMELLQRELRGIMIR